MPDADPRLVAAATALAMTDLRRCGKTAPAVLERVLPYYMAAAEVCVSAYLAIPAELGTVRRCATCGTLTCPEDGGALVDGEMFCSPGCAQADKHSEVTALVSESDRA